jgi:septation ring formation regulator EzrA
MQEFIVPLAAASTAAGLIIAGINIAKGKKNYIGRDEHAKTLERVHSRIDSNENRVDSLERKYDGLSVAVGELKSDVKDVRAEIKGVSKKQDDCNEFMREVDKNVYGIKVLLEQFQKAKGE